MVKISIATIEMQYLPTVNSIVGALSSLREINDVGQVKKYLSTLITII